MSIAIFILKQNSALEARIKSDWDNYKSTKFFDELISSSGNPRTKARAVFRLLSNMSTSEMRARKTAADLAIRDMGVSFTVYSSERNIDRTWPFDIIPRIISAKEWDRVTFCRNCIFKTKR